MDQDTTRWLRSASAALAPEEALRAPPGALLGVTPDAETAPATLEIHSVFDLAASRVFAVAAELLALQITSPTSATGPPTSETGRPPNATRLPPTPDSPGPRRSEVALLPPGP
jgi:hypothetical protein